MGRLIDISGRKFRRLTATGRMPGLFGGHVLWSCLCECGGTISASSQNIRTGHTQSCGCLQKEVMRKIRTTHGMTPGGVWSPQYRLWSSAKYRAAKKGLEFSIQPSDVIIPEMCPLLGIPIRQNEVKLCDNSATLDRIDGKIGYAKDNVWVVSYKANRSKNNLSLDELRALLSNLEAKLMTVNA